MSKQLLVLIVSCLYFSCGQEEPRPIANPTQIERYFLLKDFVEEQLVKLDGAKVSKTTRIKDEEEKTVQQFGVEEWRRELHIFIQADINKSSLATAYDTEKDSRSTIHQLKEGEKSPVQEIRVTHEGDKVSRISFVSRKENVFYKSGSSGELLLDPETGLLSSYKVSGYQDVWFLSPNEMTVEGEIVP